MNDCCKKTESGENLNKLELFNSLQKIWWKVDEAKNLVDEGKEVLCSNKLQGALTNLKQMIEELGEEIKRGNDELVQKSSDG